MAAVGNKESEEKGLKDSSPSGNSDALPSTEDQLEAIGIGPANYVILATLILFNTAYGMEILVTNISYRAMPHSAWGMTEEDRAQLVSISYVGFIAGAIIAGMFSDIYGRKPLMFTHSILFIPFVIFSALAQDLVTLYLTRLIVGTAVGIMLPVSVSYIAELAMPSQRGWMILVVPGLGFVVGQIFVLLSGMIAMQSNVSCVDDCGWWRWVFAAGVIPDAVAIALFVTFVPESPRHLLIEGRVEEAEAAIRQVAKMNNAESKLLMSGKIQPLKIEVYNHISLTEFLQPPLRESILTLTFVWTMFGFGLYTLNFIVPILLETIYHLDSFQLFASLFVYVLAEGASILVVVFTIDLKKFGRLFFLVALSFAAVPFLVASYFTTSVNVILIFIFVFLSKAAIGGAYQTMYTYAAELLPTSHRSMGIGLANGTSKSAAVLGPVLVIALKNAVGLAPCFLVMAGAVAAGAAVLVLYSHETIGHALSDVVEQMEEGTPQHKADGGEAPTERTRLI